MKWKLYTGSPKEGSKRQISKFAWFPVLVQDDEDWYNAWLETYVQEQEYRFCGDGVWMWKPVKNIALFWADC